MHNLAKRSSGTMPVLLFTLLFTTGLTWNGGSGFARADEPIQKKNGKAVPSYVAAHYDQARVRTVHANKAVVRSGPSDKYYPTSTQTKGSRLEVYIETSDGWSGIRPPSGSHDWIPSNVAYLLPGGKSAEITEDQSPAWIGSDSSEVPELLWQVSLAKAQQVQVLGEELQMADEGKKLLWYRIAPPQGEFRWVRTSQLSDLPPAPNGPAAPSKEKSEVQLASYTDESTNTFMANGIPSEGKPTEGKPTEGKIVWSDEKQAISQAERQIQSEQSAIQRKMAADGVHVSIDAPQVDVGASDTDTLFTYPASVAISNTSVRSSSLEEASRNRPIARKRNAAQHTIASPSSTEHQIDSQRQWDAMQTHDNAKLRITPLKSVLGLIGLNVIEADSLPVNSRIAQQYHANASGRNLDAIGPVGASRLDRLPRPGRRGPSMALPANSDGNMGGGFEVYESPSYAPTSTAAPAPRMSSESTFSKWLHAREPIFGAGNPGMNPAMPLNPVNTVNPLNPVNPAAQMGMNSMMAGGANHPGNAMMHPHPNMQSSLGMMPPTASTATSAWHGLAPNRPRESVTETEETGEFQTPEIQSALVNLTREVAGPTEDWRLNELRNQASAWIEGGGSAVVRGEARLLLERIESFESLRQRTLGLAENSAMLAQQAMRNNATYAMQQGINPGGMDAWRASPPVVPASAVGGPTIWQVTNAVANASAAGDASGWLVQVHTSYPGQPEFALTDDAGNIIAYVQSSASLNLRRYLQQPVTVYGVRGYLPSLAAKQIAAERIVRMKQ